jgi:succinyl-diaminopimelate desuccinylase
MRGGAAGDRLDVSDVVRLASQLVDIPSVSGDETRIADAVERALRACPHLSVDRDGDAVVARTHLGRARRVVLAGHLDTVPISANVPGRMERREQGGATAEVLWGRGSVDMLGGVAVLLHAAAALSRPRHDATWVFYDHEEVAASLNGLGRLAGRHPEWLAGDLAILGEPTAARIEGGCNGTLRVIAAFAGVAAHSARSWRGDNAIHRMGPVIERIAAFGNPVVEVDGLGFRESLSVVRIGGGRAANVIPDEATMTVNYRFAPSTTGEQALDLVRSVFEGSGAVLEVDDLAEGARPGLDSPLAQEFVRAAGRGASIGPKYGWTDVARFASLGVPALNYGPGDPMLAHTADEHVPVDQIRQCARTVMYWLERPAHAGPGKEMS